MSKNTKSPITGKNNNFPIVGIGASAGGLEAASELLKNLPLDTGMAFVFVQHLAPTHESMLSELLTRVTTMPVKEISDGMVIKPNHFYVIPPNYNLGILHGELHLMPRDDEKGQHLPIDFFLRSLAKEMSSRAIGIILSGSASDGVLGLRDIKAEGGITFAQDDTATHSSMPHSAIAAGCVDFVMSPQKIAFELVRIAQHPYIKLEKSKEENVLPGEEDNLRKIFLLLRQHFGNDFTYYKQSTILRRIKRRILLHKLERMDEYFRYLQTSPSEIEALFSDLLINVTSFFRDPEVFDGLKNIVFPTIMKDRPENAPIRIWVAGCSTGEEVYSIAITLFEFLGDMAANTPIQFFATDLDDKVVEKARSGIYPPTISDVVSDKRLQRFFTKVDDGYQISKHIRDVCIFAQQNVFKDPPFSRLDLISCRNLLIYLTPVLQKKIMPIFNYALNNKGFLLLGTSETIGRHADLFRLADKKLKLYEKKSVTGLLNFSLPDFTKNNMTTITSDLTTDTKFKKTNIDIQRQADRIVLNKYAPCGVVINEELDVIQFRGHTGGFLEPSSGEASLNLLKMARNGLQIELSNAVHKSIEENKSVYKNDLRLRINDDVKNISIEVEPVFGSDSEDRYFLVLFKEDINKVDSTENKKKEPVKKSVSDESLEIKRLQEEVRATQEYMNTVVEQQDVANEELTSANEEIQASNEELQSTNEELETAKEELQSTNEELATVNDELSSRNIQLEELSNDLSNLITGLSIPIVMVNEELKIRRFSLAAEKLLNMIPSDHGRLISHIKANITVPNLEEILLKVIDTIQNKEIEVQDNQGYWYRVEIRPYKTQDNKISGALIAFIDINQIKMSLNVAQNARHFSESIVATIGFPILVLDNNLRVVSASENFYKSFKVDEKETLGNLLYRLGNGQWGIPDLRQKLEDTISTQSGFDNYIVEHKFEAIGLRKMKVSGRYLAEGLDFEPMVLMQIEDVTNNI